MWKNGELAIDNDGLKQKLALAEEPERVSSTRTKVASLCLLTLFDSDEAQIKAIYHRSDEIRARLDTGSKAVEERSQTADTLLHSLKDTYQLPRDEGVPNNEQKQRRKGRQARTQVTHQGKGFIAAITKLLRQPPTAGHVEHDGTVDHPDQIRNSTPESEFS
ncbi:hypothetical protein FMEXI_6949 [Fusarium mexicanum]|uniref:Uncharacterized protein n=1 Tax=Fusarium mexicanum TaxID=751941 RepID=A0A8H5MWQ6_9HYPO|nr:hypothetical protein FMEXI_6949 [Fusarium mexicanum]